VTPKALVPQPSETLALFDSVPTMPLEWAWEHCSQYFLERSDHLGLRL
jgi:hypothetical protein